MKILIVTQNRLKRRPAGLHAQLDFRIFRQCEAVVAVGLSVGEYDFTLKRETVFAWKNKVTTGLAHLLFRIKFALRFISIIIRERKNYDVVLVHMNHEYVIIGAPFWKIMGKRLPFGMHTDLSQKFTYISKISRCRLCFYREWLSNKVTKKKVIDGIDTDFVPDTKRDRIFTIITVGRISPAKIWKHLFAQ